MIIKCNKDIFELSYKLKKGDEYYSLGIYFSDNKCFFLVIDNNNELVILDIKCFEIIKFPLRDFHILINNTDLKWVGEYDNVRNMVGQKQVLDEWYFIGYKMINSDIIYDVSQRNKTNFSFVHTFEDDFYPKLKKDQNALITSTTSNYKNRFVYVVKEEEQYFIFIKKSIDNNAEILETIIFESEKETIDYVEKLEVQWLD